MNLYSFNTPAIIVEEKGFAVRELKNSNSSKLSIELNKTEADFQRTYVILRPVIHFFLHDPFEPE